MKKFIIRERLFKTEVLFLVDCDNEALMNYLSKTWGIKQEVACDTVGTMLTYDHAPYRVVWVHKGKEMSTVVHELLHLVTRLCADRGVPITAHHSNGDNGDETAAYLIEYFYSEYVKRLKR